MTKITESQPFRVVCICTVFVSLCPLNSPASLCFSECTFFLVLGKVVLARDTFMHTKYISRNVTNGYDVALVLLSEVSKHTWARLPSPSDVLKPNTRLVALGWGRTHDGKTSSELQMATEITAITNSECKKDDVWGDIIKDSMICAISFNGQDVCDGE